MTDTVDTMSSEFAIRLPVLPKYRNDIYLYGTCVGCISQMQVSHPHRAAKHTCNTLTTAGSAHDLILVKAFVAGYSCSLFFYNQN